MNIRLLKKFRAENTLELVKLTYSETKCMIPAWNILWNGKKIDNMCYSDTPYYIDKWGVRKSFDLGVVCTKPYIGGIKTTWKEWLWITVWLKRDVCIVNSIEFKSLKRKRQLEKKWNESKYRKYFKPQTT